MPGKRLTSASAPCNEKMSPLENVDLGTMWTLLDQLENAYLDGDVDEPEYTRQLRQIEKRQKELSNKKET